MRDSDPIRGMCVYVGRSGIWDSHGFGIPYFPIVLEKSTNLLNSRVNIDKSAKNTGRKKNELGPSRRGGIIETRLKLVDFRIS